MIVIVLFRIETYLTDKKLYNSTYTNFNFNFLVLKMSNNSILKLNLKKKK